MSGGDAQLRGQVLEWADQQGWLTNVGPVDPAVSIVQVMVGGRRRRLAAVDVLPWVVGLADGLGLVDQLVEAFPELAEVMEAQPPGGQN